MPVLPESHWNFSAQGRKRCFFCHQTKQHLTFFAPHWLWTHPPAYQKAYLLTEPLFNWSFEKAQLVLELPCKIWSGYKLHAYKSNEFQSPFLSAFQIGCVSDHRNGRPYMSNDVDVHGRTLFMSPSLLNHYINNKIKTKLKISVSSDRKRMCKTQFIKSIRTPGVTLNGFCLECVIWWCTRVLVRSRWLTHNVSGHSVPKHLIGKREPLIP